jgi:hypothetical protein
MISHISPYLVLILFSFFIFSHRFFPGVKITDNLNRNVIFTFLFYKMHVERQGALTECRPHVHFLKERREGSSNHK